MNVEPPVIVGVSALTSDAPLMYTVGTTIVTWTASDESGNTASAEQTVTIVDTIPPLIAAPEDIILEAQNPIGEQVVLGTASASDVVGISEITNDAPEIFPFGTTIVTWTATDISGNSNSAVQTVTVHDTVPPSITAPQNITVEAQNPTSNQIDLGIAKTDDAIGVVEVKHNSPLHFPLGTTLVTWTATDASGNSASDVQTIVVRDTTDPVLVTPLDHATSAGGVKLGATVS